MGYYTYHELAVKGISAEIDHEKEISDSTSYDDCFDHAIKWYEHEEDMRAYSAWHPDLIFELKGEGEEAGDLWIEYYKNGKMQRCEAQIMYAKFDESELI